MRWLLKWWRETFTVWSFRVVERLCNSVWLLCVLLRSANVCNLLWQKASKEAIRTTSSEDTLSPTWKSSADFSSWHNRGEGRNHSFLSACFYAKPDKPNSDWPVPGRKQGAVILTRGQFCLGNLWKTKIGKWQRKEKIAEAHLGGFVQCSLKTRPHPSLSAPQFWREHS